MREPLSILMPRHAFADEDIVELAPKVRERIFDLYADILEPIEKSFLRKTGEPLSDAAKRRMLRTACLLWSIEDLKHVRFDEAVPRGTSNKPQAAYVYGQSAAVYALAHHALTGELPTDKDLWP